MVLKSLSTSDPEENFLPFHGKQSNVMQLNEVKNRFFIFNVSENSLYEFKLIIGSIKHQSHTQEVFQKVNSFN